MTATITQIVKEEVMAETADYKSLFKEDFQFLEKELLGWELKMEDSKSCLFNGLQVFLWWLP